MRFSVSHETLYRYSVPVGLAPHLLRLTPRPDAGRLLMRELTVDPWPALRLEEFDAFGNPVTRVEFVGQFSSLRVESRFLLDTIPPPRGLMPVLSPLPWAFPLNDGLDVYRSQPWVDAAVAQFAHGLASQVGHSPMPFLELLNRTLHDTVDGRARVSGDAQSPAQTLASGRGACRDVTVLFMAACRCFNLPVRFVSGYHAPPGTPEGPGDLHAWAEVSLPGVGWLGWDPTNGIPAGEAHVAVCATPEQAGSMPVEGGFFANGVTATLDSVAPYPVLLSGPFEQPERLSAAATAATG